MQALKKAKKPIPDDMVDKKQAYDIKMNMLVTLIQLGKLDMNGFVMINLGYIKQVKQSIIETKEMALIFKQASKLDLAKHAVVRIKLMTEEVAEVESG